MCNLMSIIFRIRVIPGEVWKKGNLGRAQKGLTWVNHIFFMYVEVKSINPFSLTDGIRKVWEWPICLPNKPLPNVWIYDQLHPQAQTLTREIYDEQCFGKLHYFIGNCFVSSCFVRLSHEAAREEHRVKKQNWLRTRSTLIWRPHNYF